MHSGLDLRLIETEAKKKDAPWHHSWISAGITEFHAGFIFFFKHFLQHHIPLSKHPCEHVSKITPTGQNIYISLSSPLVI